MTGVLRGMDKLSGVATLSKLLLLVMTEKIRYAISNVLSMQPDLLLGIFESTVFSIFILFFYFTFFYYYHYFFFFYFHTTRVMVSLWGTFSESHNKYFKISPLLQGFIEDTAVCGPDLTAHKMSSAIFCKNKKMLLFHVC